MKNLTVCTKIKEKKEWIDFFDFVYTNSLDQSYDPRKALEIWLDQIKKNGYMNSGIFFIRKDSIIKNFI